MKDVLTDMNYSLFCCKRDAELYLISIITLRLPSTPLPLFPIPLHPPPLLSTSSSSPLPTPLQTLPHLPGPQLHPHGLEFGLAAAGGIGVAAHEPDDEIAVLVEGVGAAAGGDVGVVGVEGALGDEGEFGEDGGVPLDDVFLLFFVGCVDLVALGFERGCGGV